MNALFWVGVTLVLLWLIGWAVFRIAGFAVQLLLIVGVVLLVWWAIGRIVGMAAARRGRQKKRPTP